MYGCLQLRAQFMKLRTDAANLRIDRAQLLCNTFLVPEEQAERTLQRQLSRRHHVGLPPARATMRFRLSHDLAAYAAALPVGSLAKRLLPGLLHRFILAHELTIENFTTSKHHTHIVLAYKRTRNCSMTHCLCLLCVWSSYTLPSIFCFPSTMQTNKTCKSNHCRRQLISKKPSGAT